MLPDKPKSPLYYVIYVAAIVAFGLLVEKVLLSCQPKSEQSVEALPQGVSSVIPALNKPDEFVNALPDIGLQPSRRGWHAAEEGGYYFSTDYTTLGEINPSNGMENNLALYGESEEGLYIKELHLVLNINNRKQEKVALASLAGMLANLFGQLSIKLPDMVEKLIKRKENGSFDGDFGIVQVEIDKTKIESIKVTIKPKLVKS